MRAPRLLSVAVLSLGLATTTLASAQAAPPPDETVPVLTIASVPSKVPDPPAASGKAPRIGTVMAGLGDMIGGGSRTVPGPP